MSTRLRWLILAFALAGIGVAGASTWIHHRLIVDPTYVSPCDINAKFNCTQVYLSRFGTVAGVPVAFGGLVWFTLVALVAGLHRSGATGGAAGEDATGGYLFVLATIGLAVILYLGYASFFVLHEFCLFCMATYVCVLAIFILSGLGAPMAVTRLPGRLARDLRHVARDPLLTLVALLYLAGVGLGVWVFISAPVSAAAASAAPVPTDAKQAFLDSWAQQPRVDLGIPADGAKVVVVKFNDWQCPSCKAWFLAYQPILEKYAATMPGVVKYVTKDYPLNPACNPSVGGVTHVAACQAAAAVRMAADRGKADAMELWLFNNQEELTPDMVKQGAKEVAGITDFDQEYPRELPAIEQDAADGAALHIMFTPTYYINGIKASDAEGHQLPPEYFQLAVQYEIDHAGSGGRTQQ